MPGVAPAPAAPLRPAVAAPRPEPAGDDLAVSPDGQLPREFIAIPIWSQQAAAPLKICAIVRKAPDPLQGALLHRRDLLDAKIYLGCITDAIGVVEFLEIWVQNLDGLAEAAKARILCGDAINNTTIDNRWRGMFDVSSTSWAGALIACGFEKSNPPPTFLDVKQTMPVHPDGWRLCRDDEALRGADLPPYATTIHRYLFRGTANERRFVPLSPDAPRNGNTVEYETVLPDLKRLAPLNPGGGLILLRHAANLRLREYAETLGGKKFEGAAYGKSRLRAGPLRALESSSGGGFFPGEPNTNASRFVETYLLKVSLLASMIDEVGRFTKTTQRPLLNLQPASFAVTLNDAGPHLPSLWTARAMLIDSGDAVPFTFPQGETSYKFFLPGKSVRTSIYQPSTLSRGPITGFGQLYLSGGALPEKAASKVFDGVLTVTDPIRPTRRDIIRVRLPIGDQRVDLYVRVDPNAGPSPSVLKFRSVPDARLRSLESAIPIGVPQEAAFEFYPLFGSACDVYSLSVLGVEILLTRPISTGAAAGATFNHAEQLRDLLNLAMRCRETYSQQPLETRIRAIFMERSDWLQKLGPHCLIGQTIAPDVAMRYITPDLWWSTLALLIRMLPGNGYDSALLDLGDMSGERMEGIYDVLQGDLTTLIQRGRNLLFGEWGMNRELGGILRDMAQSARQTTK
ncbi:MAG TPA: hypothetical protein VG326_05445 [Tepidisphaeraceae bacterium]|nr:hypothetical protein [Tepidisphaeraceae bacterium]